MAEGARWIWDLRSEGGNVLTLAPYPFKREVLELSILARRIPKRVYVDEMDFQKTLAESAILRNSDYAAGAAHECNLQRG